MILATIIRLEMAYPGIGVLAGDSLQYLSVVTAHAVIMVFFMIMPLLFGAFGNFLLPTQLGVHDVAFPRLNSAAFWFLPGGLLMLAQLVCLDRRYQRMNCFNIRELQTLLKNRYHPELLDESLHTDFLSQTVLNTRFKLFDISTINPKMNLFYEFSTLKSSNDGNSEKVQDVFSKSNDLTLVRTNLGPLVNNNLLLSNAGTQNHLVYRVISILSSPFSSSLYNFDSKVSISGVNSSRSSTSVEFFDARSN